MKVARGGGGGGGGGGVEGGGGGGEGKNVERFCSFIISWHS